ncbi:MAG TPA: hypothetical protein VN622_05870 [Clostridia bacterium]|nr:hypothetical protein [Clostridia bacterium]
MKSVNIEKHLPTHNVLRKVDKAMAEVFFCYVISANAYRQVVLPDRVLVEVLDISKRKVYESKRGLLNLKAIERSPFFPVVNGKEQVFRVRKPDQTVVNLLMGFGLSEADTLAELKRIHTYEHQVLSVDASVGSQAVAGSQYVPFVPKKYEDKSRWSQLLVDGDELIYEYWELQKGILTVPKGLQGTEAGEQYARLAAFATNALNYITESMNVEDERLNQLEQIVPDAFYKVYPELKPKFDDDGNLIIEQTTPPSSTEATGALPVSVVEVGHPELVKTAIKPDVVPFDKRDYSPELGLSGEAAERNVLRKKIVGIVDGWNARAKTLGLEPVFLTKKERNGEMPFRNKMLAERIAQWLDGCEDEWLEMYKCALERLNNSVCLGEIEAIGSFRASLGWLFNTAPKKGRLIDRLLCADYMQKEEPTPDEVSNRQWANVILKRCKQKGIESFEPVVQKLWEMDKGDAIEILGMAKIEVSTKAQQMVSKLMSDAKAMFDHDYFRIEWAHYFLNRETATRGIIQITVVDFIRRSDDQSLMGNDEGGNIGQLVEW